MADYAGSLSQYKPNRTGDRVATIILLVVHLLLAMFTALVSLMPLMIVGLSGCEPGAKGCEVNGSGFAIAWGGSFLLFALDVIVSIVLMAVGRLAFYVPLACCLGQIGLVWATLTFSVR
jgi:hypothetical protein